MYTIKLKTKFNNNLILRFPSFQRAVAEAEVWESTCNLEVINCEGTVLYQHINVGGVA